MLLKKRIKFRLVALAAIFANADGGKLMSLQTPISCQRVFHVEREFARSAKDRNATKVRQTAVLPEARF